MRLTDTIFVQMLEEYSASLSENPASSTVFQYIYASDVAPFYGKTEYRLNANNDLSARDIAGFRYQLMTNFNRLLSGRAAKDENADINFTIFLCESTIASQAKYLSGLTDITAGLSYFIPFFATALRLTEKEIADLKVSFTENTMRRYLQWLLILTKENSEKLKTPKLAKVSAAVLTRLSKIDIRQSLSEVPTEVYKNICDRLLLSSVHNTIQDFFSSVGHPFSKKGKNLGRTARKSDRTVELLEAYVKAHGLTLAKTVSAPTVANTEKTIAPEEYDELLKLLKKSDNKNIFLPLETDSSGTGIYILGAEHFSYSSILTSEDDKTENNKQLRRHSNVACSYAVISPTIITYDKVPEITYDIKNSFLESDTFTDLRNRTYLPSIRKLQKQLQSINTIPSLNTAAIPAELRSYFPELSREDETDFEQKRQQIREEQEKSRIAFNQPPDPLPKYNQDIFKQR